jgi:hypothetical protein
MTSELIADSIVNACGALGVAIAWLTLRRRDPDGAWTRVINTVLLVVLGLLFTRAVAWWTGSHAIENLSLVFASLVPIGALVTTEVTLRRHAPRLIKLAIAVSSLGLGLVALLGAMRASAGFSTLLAIVQAASFVSCALLIMTRNREDLSATENAAITRLGFAALLIVPLLLTDFRSLVPDVPVRLGALAALLAVSLMLHGAGAGGNMRQQALLLGTRVTAAALLGLAAAQMTTAPSASDAIRFALVAVAGVLAIGMLVDAVRQRFEVGAPDLLASLALARGATRDDMLDQLRQHPVFASATRLCGPMLATHDPPILQQFLAARPLLRSVDWPWGLATTDPAVERAWSLMKSHQATHMLVLDAAQPDLVALTVPPAAADPATETAIALARRILAAGQEQRRGNPA